MRCTRTITVEGEEKEVAKFFKTVHDYNLDILSTRLESGSSNPVRRTRGHWFEDPDYKFKRVQVGDIIESKRGAHESDYDVDFGLEYRVTGIKPTGNKGARLKLERLDDGKIVEGAYSHFFMGEGTQ